MAVDMVIPAIGQEAGSADLNDSGIAFSRLGTIEVDEVTYMTSRPGVFAAGDAHTGPWIAIEAVGGGIEAAESIDRYIKGVDMHEGRVRGIAARQRWREIPKDEEGRPREIMPTLPPEISSICFAEIAQGYSEAAGPVRGLPLPQLRDLLRVHAMRGGLPGRGHRPQPEAGDGNPGGRLGHPGPGLQTLRSQRHGGLRLRQVPQRLHQPGVRAHPQPRRALWRPRAAALRRQGAQKDRLDSLRRLPELREGAKPYCSNFCCMASLKQAIVAREHLGPDLDMALFYMDMRTPRKDFEKYCVKIKDQGARLIRSRVHSIKPAGDDGDLEVRYVTEAGEVADEIFDAVVLSVGMVIPPATMELAKKAAGGPGPQRLRGGQLF